MVPARPIDTIEAWIIAVGAQVERYRLVVIEINFLLLRRTGIAFRHDAIGRPRNRYVAPKAVRIVMPGQVYDDFRSSSECCTFLNRRSEATCMPSWITIT